MQNQFKTLFLASVCTLAFMPAHADDNISPNRWNAYCKSNSDHCAKAEMLCESPTSAMTCDQIKMSFILKRPLPKQDS